MNDIRNAVEKYRGLILEAERHIWKNPETGYKEVKTSKYMAEIFEDLGYELVFAENIPGFYTVLDTGKEGPEVLVLAELDSIICPDHPEADKKTGAVHSCGHHAQCAALIGVAAALRDEKVLEKLCGRIRLCAVPAEELLEIEYRRELREKGIIKYFGGKNEFLSRGFFDGADIAFLVHTTNAGFTIRKGSVGCMAKNIIYKGKAAHAGGSPWNGRNALYAATCGLNAVNAVRECFKEEDRIRVHPIITKGGDMVNAIPETVTLESYVRGSSFEAICEANKKVDQALIGAALSLGNNIEIIDIPGYAPLLNDDNMMLLAKDAAEIALEGHKISYTDTIVTGSTDMGDLSCIMPTVQPYATGAVGTGHGSDYYIENPELACVESAKWQACMLKLLLENKAERAKKILAEFKPRFASKDEYLSYIDRLNRSGDRIEYSDGSAKVIL